MHTFEGVDDEEDIWFQNFNDYSAHFYRFMAVSENRFEVGDVLSGITYSDLYVDGSDNLKDYTTFATDLYETAIDEVAVEEEEESSAAALAGMSALMLAAASVF